MKTIAPKITNRLPQKDGETKLPAAKRVEQRVVITPPNFGVSVFNLIGVTPLMLNRFSEKAKTQMKNNQQEGEQARKGKKRSSRDFAADYEAAKYTSTEGWLGMPAGAFRTAMIDACRLCGFKMTLAKMTVFIIADGADKFDATPLVRIYGDPEMNIGPARNADGSCDLRSRPLWKNWNVNLRVQYDADLFTTTDVTNLLLRVSVQVGVGEGRPYSRNSNGKGFGLFRIAQPNG
jgi:hypothetical protein